MALSYSDTEVEARAPQRGSGKSRRNSRKRKQKRIGRTGDSKGGSQQGKVIMSFMPSERRLFAFAAIFQALFTNRDTRLEPQRHDKMCSRTRDIFLKKTAPARNAPNLVPMVCCLIHKPLPGMPKTVDQISNYDPDLFLLCRLVDKAG